MYSDKNSENLSHSNSDIIRTLGAIFAKTVNILVIDDDPKIGEILVNDLFVSPLLNLIYAKSLNEAIDKIASTNKRWHCWIVDINLKEQNDGSSLLDKFPNFDYAVIFSGASTLETASNALKKGAIAAFSKDPAFLFYSDAFYNEVCKAASLSFILRGAHIEHRNVFQPLFSNQIISVEQWADKIHLSQRQLQRICELYAPFTPRMLLQLYHSFYYLIRDPSFTENFETPTAEDIRIKNDTEFYLNCIDSVFNKLDSYYKLLIG